MLQSQAQYGLPFEVAASTSAVYTGAGTIQGVIVASHTTGTIKVYDSLTQAGTVIVNTFSFPTGSGSYSFFGAKFKTGVSVTVGGTADVTFIIAPYNG